MTHPAVDELPVARAASLIGVSRPRLDSEEKLLGATRYAADVPVPGLLHARLVLSLESHARIEGIERSDALRAPGVVAVLTAADLPIVAEGDSRMHEPLARAEVVYAGQPVAMVVAESEAAAEDAAEAVRVDYAPLTPVLDLEAAMAPDAPIALERGRDADGAGVESIHAAVGAGSEDAAEEHLSGNVVGRRSYSRGDASAALSQSDAVATGRFRTSWVHQAYLEPQVATAWVEPDGELVVSTSTQGPFYTRDHLAQLFDLPVAKIRIVPAALGGAFGGKLLIVEPLAAAAALRLRRPVRLALTRTEDFAATNPAPGSIIELRIGGRRTGELTGLEARIVCDRGANAEWGLEGFMGVLVAGPYRWPAWTIRGYGVLTNRVTLGSYRAPGAPPSAFAIESLMDELAEALEIDPVELRIQNAAGEGDAGVDGKEWPRLGVSECLERLRDHPLWQGRGRLPPDEGVGIAVAMWPGGLGPAAAMCRLESDGRLTVITGAVDMSGAASGFALVAAETFGVPLARVSVVMGDTASAPHAPVSGGSKITYTVGRAVQQAAAKAREQLLQVAAGELEVAPWDLEIADGMVRAVGAPDRGLPLAELARRAVDFSSRYEPVEGHAGTTQTSLAPSSAAHLAHVRVDRATGRVDLLGYAVAQDVGRALNPALVEGQMQGGAAQGIGWALFEELVHDEHGQPLTLSLVDYCIPSAADLPEIETHVVEVPAPDGPFGAKGIGEASVAPAPGAIANGIAAATGVRMRELPMTAPRVWDALGRR